MRNAETVLGVICERGTRGLPLERVYRLLFSRELYLHAYGRLYRNDGALTRGATADTVDGMSLAKIDHLIDDVRHERHRWTPVRRVSIPKSNGKTRPLGIPTWTDKLLQEVIRMILEAYYEPQFSPRSHGFRPRRGCHTALREAYRTWNGTAWFIEGDISQCFDSLDHQVLLSILRETIHDNRFIRLIENLLTAGYLEDWKFNATLSGTPQGGVVSPILSNIYLDRLDKWIEMTLLPAYTCGTERKYNTTYTRTNARVQKLRRIGQRKEALALRKQIRTLPTHDPTDPDYRRLRYVRYADDFLLGLAGPRFEAEEIKARLGEFLRDTLKLELSKTKTLITHARTEAARFLGYEIGTFHDNTRRSINGAISLRVPAAVARAKCEPYMRSGKPVHRPEMEHDSPYSIVSQYQQEFRGVVEYYQLAYNRYRFNRLKWIMGTSLAKTLGHKLRLSVQQVWNRYGATTTTSLGTYRVLRVTVDRGDKQAPLVAHWGGISLSRRIGAILNDQPKRVWNIRHTELLERVLANICELCSSTVDIEVHHIRHLRDLQRKGRGELPAWVQKMAARHRKTLVVCSVCHHAIHDGRVVGRQKRPNSLTQS